MSVQAEMKYHPQFPDEAFHHLSNKTKLCHISHFVAVRDEHKTNNVPYKYITSKSLNLAIDGLYYDIKETMSLPHKLESVFDIEATIATEANLSTIDFGNLSRIDFDNLSLIFHLLIHPDFGNFKRIVNKVFIALSSAIVHPHVQMLYGVLLTLFSQQIFQLIASQTVLKLKENIINYIEKRSCLPIKPMRILLFVRKLKNCAKSEEIWDVGISYFEQALESYQNHIYYEFFDDIIRNIKLKYNNIKKVKYLTINLILLKRDVYCTLFENVIVCRALSNLYYYQKKYWMGYKSLQNAYKLANGYILQKSFVETDYQKKKRKFMEKFEKLKCDNCNMRYKYESPLKPCQACMKSTYCSKKCQKVHWKLGHNYECDKEWERLHCISMEHSFPYVGGIQVAIEIEIEMEHDICDKHMEYNGDCDECKPLWLHIVDGYKYIDKIRNGNDIVAPKSITLKIDYPLKKSFLFEIKRSKAITKKELVKIVLNIYKHIYKKEDETATERLERSCSFNRCTTNGVYGIWGHRIGDLILNHIYHHGNCLYSLSIDS